MNAVDRVDSSVLVARRFRIDTRQEPVIFLRRDSPVARAEGFDAMSRVRVELNQHAIIATLMIVGPELLQPGEAGLSEIAWRRLDIREGERVSLSHPRPVESLSLVRAKVYGRELGAEAFLAIVQDIVAGRYMDVHLAAFVTACANGRLSAEEIIHLSRAMVDCGQRLEWPGKRIFDKHCVGGLPGNRTTPIVVSIVAASGLVIPKTSSRAITSPAGTADTMEMLAPVELEIEHMRRVVEQEGGCIAWGGSVSMSPADDLLIRVERALEIDSEGQLIASVLSKKLAAGATDVVIDMPVGPTAKVRTNASAENLSRHLVATGAAIGLNVEVLQSDGSQPVGYGIGPALEARDVLAVLQGHAAAPPDLAERASAIAGTLLEMAEVAVPGTGAAAARRALGDGSAWAKFQAICAAQGGMREPPRAAYRHEVLAAHAGEIEAIDNRVVARIAKLAGAPAARAAGVEITAKLGMRLAKGESLMTIHAESPGELEYACDYEKLHPEAIRLSERR